MTFQPIVPTTGYVGWKFLQRTYESQAETFNESVTVKRDTDAFMERIKDVKTVDDLMDDRQLLRVALGAFGLEGDINNTYFIRKILEDGAEDDDALANRLADKHYKQLTEAFKFDDPFGPDTWRPSFAHDMVERFERQQFQVAVGEQNNDLRLALNLKAELGEIAAGEGSSDTKWFGIMGSTPVRTVFETAMGFPSSFGAIDIDQQHEQFRDRARSMFGTDDLTEINSDENREKLIRLFLVRSEAQSFSAAVSSGQTALALLSTIQRPQY